MDNYKTLYNFLEFAKNNKRYAESVANNIKSALKIFEKELTIQEADSIELAKNNIDEIFLGVVGHNKEKSIGSLNAYKARVIRVMDDYQKYGKNPSKIQTWEPKQKKSTSLSNIKDKKDKSLSFSTHTHVNNINKIELSLENGIATIILPVKISKKEALTIKGIVDALAQDLLYN